MEKREDDQQYLLYREKWNSIFFYLFMKWKWVFGIYFTFGLTFFYHRENVEMPIQLCNSFRLRGRTFWNFLCISRTERIQKLQNLEIKISITKKISKLNFLLAQNRGMKIYIDISYKYLLHILNCTEAKYNNFFERVFDLF